MTAEIFDKELYDMVLNKCGSDESRQNPELLQFAKMLATRHIPPPDQIEKAYMDLDKRYRIGLIEHTMPDDLKLLTAIQKFFEYHVWMSIDDIRMLMDMNLKNMFTFNLKQKTTVKPHKLSTTSYVFHR